jgi:anthranilate synthase component 2
VKKILILDNNDSFSHNLRHLLRMGGKHQVDVVPSQDYAMELALTYDALALSPGPGLPDDHVNLKKAILEMTGKRPIWGVCLGHQAIAEAFGASLFNLPNVLHGIKSVVTITDSNGLWQGITNPEPVGRYHSWMVDEKTLPPQLVISSRDSEGRIMSFYHREYPIFGVQFHPESFMTNQGYLLAQNFINRFI